MAEHFDLGWLVAFIVFVALTVRDALRVAVLFTTPNSAGPREGITASLGMVLWGVLAWALWLGRFA